jgi:hypothetical protein
LLLLKKTSDRLAAEAGYLSPNSLTSFDRGNDQVQILCQEPERDRGGERKHPEGGGKRVIKRNCRLLKIECGNAIDQNIRARLQRYVRRLALAIGSDRPVQPLRIRTQLVDVQRVFAPFLLEIRIEAQRVTHAAENALVQNIAETGIEFYAQG